MNPTMELISGHYYWLRGEGIGQFQGMLGASAIFATYDHTDDTFWGAGYVAPTDVLREATDQDVATFKANVQERLGGGRGDT